MKLIIYCIVVLVALANKTPVEQATFDESLTSKLKLTNVGRAVLILAQVHGQEALTETLDTMGESFQAQIEAENQDYQNEQNTVAGDRQHYNRLEAQYATEIAQYSIDIRQLTQSKSSMEGTLQNKNNELITLKAQRAIHQNLIDTDDKTVRTRMSNVNAIITVLDKAISLIEGARDQSFIETNHHEYSTAAEDMNRAFAEDNQFLYQPIVNALIEVTKGFADQKTLQMFTNYLQNNKRTLRLLQSVRGSFNENRQSLQSGYEAESNSNQNILAQDNALASQLADVIIADLQEDIETRQNQISQKQELLSAAQTNLSTAQNHLSGVEALFIERSNSNAILIQNYQSQIEAVEECVESLNADGQ